MKPVKNVRSDLTLPVDLHTEVKAAVALRQTTMKQAIIDGLYLWLHAPKTSADGTGQPVAVDSMKLPYRKNNLAWHARLERVLDDSTESVGVRKYLEYAEKEIAAKPVTRKRSGS